MKCPYRINTTIITRRTSSGIETEDGMVQEFAECYGDTCPYYHPRVAIGCAVVGETCGRVINEKSKSRKEI